MRMVLLPDLHFRFFRNLLEKFQRVQPHRFAVEAAFREDDPLEFLSPFDKFMDNFLGETSFEARGHGGLSGNSWDFVPVG
jgi:hypothetical protein